jgi:hypothetical protein
MATPNYKGENQPTPNGSGWFGSWLGGTPAYKSVEKKPASTAQSSSASAVDAMTGVESDACGPAPFAIVIPREVIERQ